MLKSLVYLTCSLLLAQNVTAQIPGERLYLPYNGPEVLAENGRKIEFAWAGGANNPQLAMADLNNDKINDLVMYDPYGGVRAFLNTSKTPGSPKYVHHPEFEGNFPSYINGFLKLEDYNRDGIADLFFRGFSGVTPYRGYYNSQNQLCFDKNTKFSGFTGLYYLTGGSGMVNVYVAPNDLPAIGDVDGDGDLDILTYDISGTNIYFYRNCQVEEGLPKDSIKICVKDGCWGKTAQLYQRQLYLGIYCFPVPGSCKGCDDPSTGAKTTHSGNTLCMTDFDNDNDKDIFNGNVSFSDIQYTRNGRKDINYPRDTMVAEDTLWGSNGKTVFMPQQPAAFWLDIDNNGVKDLAFSPYIPNTENYKCLSYYKNMGTVASPNFVYQSDTLLMQDMIDVGTASSPVFYDYNKDGKPDMFVGGEGFYQASNGTMKTVVHYYENTSTATASSFQLKNRDFMNFGSANLDAASLAFGDLDGDGKDDMVIGKKDGTIIYLRNNAASNLVLPIWQNPITLNDQAGTMDVGDYAAPFIYDINKDGKNDLVVGTQYGRLYYYKNLGGAVAPTYNPYYTLVTDTLGGILVNEYGSTATFTSPYIGKIDNSGKDYLLIGSGFGIIYRYDNFQSGTSSVYTLIDSGYSSINVTARAKPTVADIDGDGNYEMAVGNQVGGVTLYKQYFNVDVKDMHIANGGVKIYPNPANSIINVGWLPSFGTGNVHITLVSVTGQRLFDTDVDAARTNAQIDVSAIPNGTYYCIVRSSDNQASSPVSILR